MRAELAGEPKGRNTGGGFNPLWLRVYSDLFRFFTSGEEVRGKFIVTVLYSLHPVLGVISFDKVRRENFNTFSVNLYFIGNKIHSVMYPGILTTSWTFKVTNDLKGNVGGEGYKVHV